MDKGVFDFLNRHQVYLEGMKSWYHQDFLRYIRALAADLRKLFGGVSVEKLSDLTKSAYSRLVRKVMELVQKHLTNHGNEWLLEVRRFARIDGTMQRSAFSSLMVAKDFTDATTARVWAAVKDSPIPAFGQTVKEAAEDFIDRAKEQARKVVAQSYVDAEDTITALKKVVGEGAEYTDGVLKQIASSGRSMISTALQHVSAKASELIGRIAYDCYQWCSVIDTRTSPTCRERNGQIYRYGDGPQPPAHPHCRSRTVPCPCDDAPSRPPSLLAWLRGQSVKFLRDAFGPSIAARVKDGTLELTELSATGLIPALSVDDFETKTAMLTA